MKKIVLLSILFLAIDTKQNAQELSPVNSRPKQLSHSYGFIKGQRYSLQFISKKFPGLAQSARLASFSFDSSSLGEGFNGAEDELKTILGNKWLDYETALSSEIPKINSDQQLTKVAASAFIEEVKRRGKGELPESIRATLLSANPRYKKNPGLELTEGWKQVFKSKGHPKSKGADFSVSLPASWSKKEGSRPNIINVYTSGAGHGDIVCMFMVKDLPLPDGYKPTEKELKETFQPESLKGMVPKSGTFIQAKYIVLDGMPAGLLVCDMSGQRLDYKFTMRQTQFMIFFNNQFIIIQLAVSKMPDTRESLDSLQKKYLPTHYAIANTLVLNRKYKK